MHIYDAFVYGWRNKTTGRIYIGYHVGKEDDGYICSSAEMQADYQKQPENFVRMILFRGTREQCYDVEHNLLKLVDAKNDPQFYNLWNSTPFNKKMFDTSKIAAAARKRWANPKFKARVSKKMSAGAKKRWSDPEARKRRSEEFKAMHREVNK